MHEDIVQILESFYFDGDEPSIDELSYDIARLISYGDGIYVPLRETEKEVEKFLRQSIIYNDCKKIGELDEADLYNIMDELSVLVDIEKEVK